MTASTSESPYGPPLLIANPSAGRGRNAVLPRLGAALDSAGLTYDIATTDGPGHATELAAEAAMSGRRLIVAVGGDGTVHEVVNGLVDAEAGTAIAPEAVLGLVAGGSGSDFMRTFGLPADPERIVKHLLGDAVFPIDVGRVRYTAADGTEAVRLFANIAEAGWGADVTDLANRLPRWLGGSRYVVATLIATGKMRQIPATVTIDHTETTEAVAEIVVANGQFFGGGLKVAPRALPDDGTYNVQTWRTARKDVLAGLRKVRHGEHLGDPTIREWQSTSVQISGETPLTLEADGEVLGTTPARFDLLPKVLRVKI